MLENFPLKFTIVELNYAQNESNTFLSQISFYATYTTSVLVGCRSHRRGSQEVRTFLTHPMLQQTAQGGLFPQI